MGDLEKIREQLMYLSEKMSQSNRKSYDFGDGIDLYKSEIHTIDIIGRFQGIHVSEIARKFGVTKGAVSQLLKKLEKKQLIDKYPDKSNNTRILIRLTERGELAFKKHNMLHEVEDRKLYNFLENLDDHDMKILYSFLVEVNEMCEKHI